MSALIPFIIEHFARFAMNTMVSKMLLSGVTTGIYLLSSPAWADKSLAVSKGCMACHRVDFKYAAPSFQDIAQKYKDQKQAVDSVMHKIVQGSSGAWGAYMAPNQNVNADEAKQLAQWIVGIAQ